MLKLKNLTVAYKDNVVLDNLSLTANKGEIIGVVGPNGTGKTTLFNVMANYIQPKSGSVIFNEKHTYKSEKEEIYIRKNLTTFPDQSDLFDELTGTDHMKLYGNMWKGTTKDVTEIVNYLQMNDYVNKKVGTYSLGMRQRLCFAMMVAADTPVMIMDEVMNGLDIANVALISRKLIEMRKENKLIFIASHLLENLDLYADRVIFLKKGKIIHEQLYKEDDSEPYIKIDLKVDQYAKLKKDSILPFNHLFIANHLLCISLKDMPLSQQEKWINLLLHQFNEKELTIGPLGTVEYYERYYLENE